MYVHSPTLCSHGVKTDGKLQTTPNKDVLKSIKKAIDGRIWAAIAVRIPTGMPPGTQRERRWAEENGGWSNGRRRPVKAVMELE